LNDFVYKKIIGGTFKGKHTQIDTYLTNTYVPRLPLSGKIYGGYLKKSQQESRDELGVKVLKTFYDLDSGTMFCLIDAPDKYAVERHHSKFRMKCD
jgi:Protein of unknown function (DUF4242)